MQAFRHWTSAQKAEYLMAKCLALLPVNWTSDIGAYLGNKEAQKAIKAKRLWIDRLRKNLEHLCDIQDAEERERRVVAFISRIGRIYAEFMVQQKIIKKNQIEISGRETLDSIDKPVIVVSCHLSNWELIGHVAALLQRPCCDLYLPPDNPVREYLALEARHKWPIPLELVPTSPSCMRQISKALSNGSNSVLFIDEMRDGYVSAPSLGRNIPYAGNRWFAARLAIKHELDILPAYILPNGKGHYRAIVEPLIQPSTFEGSKEEKAKKIADKLDETINSWVSENLEHWYWLPYYEPQRGFPAVKK
ncbi:lysophospholipid acyltransferase family protein [Nitrincola nitratireducens]|uniref:Lipid A biosynthesis lauroyl acyltransferase n=1 Tax=Nitrincola nitratireducens TaxID=1229521 RepID=W9V0J3_9GAMM|nr:lysophospholipid acyltransferase family protein [Nitrincola nitratireducens]EXJ12834.1 lipid A biosynthesis lauroyl acyltransferase [Nitrincola nitratireducens]